LSAVAVNLWRYRRANSAKNLLPNADYLDAKLEFPPDEIGHGYAASTQGK
jgi:hypothetical protein